MKHSIVRWWLVAALVLLGCQTQLTNETPYQGTLEHEQKVLSFELPGRVVDVVVERGDVLKRYQTMARLDDTLVRIEKGQLEAQARASAAELDLLYQGTRKETIRRARARLNAALADVSFQTAELKRARDLYQGGVATAQQLENRQTQKALADARLEEARGSLAELQVGPRAQEIQAGEARLEAAKIAIDAASEKVRRHVLYAPGPGEVLDVPVQRGEYLAPGSPAVLLADTARPFVDVFVPQAAIGAFSVGKAVSVRVDTYSQAFLGRVQFISPRLEFSPRFLFSPRERPNLVTRVRVRVHDPKRQLKAGIVAFVDPDAVTGPEPPPLASLIPASPAAPLDPPASEPSTAAPSPAAASGSTAPPPQAPPKKTGAE